MYVHVYARAENEATEEMSHRAWRFSRILKPYQLFVPGAAQLANGGKRGPRYAKIQARKFVQNAVSTVVVVVFAIGDIQSADGIPMVFYPAATPLIGVTEYYFLIDE